VRGGSLGPRVRQVNVRASFVERGCNSREEKGWGSLGVPGDWGGGRGAVRGRSASEGEEGEAASRRGASG